MMKSIVEIRSIGKIRGIRETSRLLPVEFKYLLERMFSVHLLL